MHGLWKKTSTDSQRRTIKDIAPFVRTNVQPGKGILNVQHSAQGVVRHLVCRLVGVSVCSEITIKR